MRTMTGHQARIPSLSWFGHTLSSGCRDGSIWHHDVRVARHKVMELSGHTGEVSHSSRDLINWRRRNLKKIMLICKGLWIDLEIGRWIVG